LLNTSHPA